MLYAGNPGAPQAAPASQQAPPIHAPMTSAPNVVTTYLRDTFPAHFQQIAHAQATYATAYQHCLVERYGMSVCHEAGITFGRTIVAGHTPSGQEILPNDVAIAAGLPPATFATFRTEFVKVRQARALLKRYMQRVRDHGPVPGVTDENAVKFSALLPVLDAMLGDQILDQRFLSDSTGSAEAEAVNIGIGPFMVRINNARTVLCNHVIERMLLYVKLYLWILLKQNRPARGDLNMTPLYDVVKRLLHGWTQQGAEEDIQERLTQISEIYE
ncbi:hypothetical protein B0H11DRAFT_1943453 [Mycena galericulata]|nr:hypothetical protein B0H11DRAFT_1943453 [Mycena galericulata]